MAIGVTIDFDNTYEITSVSDDLRVSVFNTELATGQTIPLRVEISSEAHELLPSVYNLAFGPTDKRGKIDDVAEIAHSDYSKVFSSILLSALTFLTDHPDQYLGIDGSNNARAFLYYRFIQRNFDYLDQFFDMQGLKYYVRITRFGKSQYDNPFDFKDIQPKTVRVAKNESIQSNFMYNYFIFKLKDHL